ncbi:hypothetical protein IEQ34_003044 [Dendrobium chrysotoxum]|uniref:Uncharacterized protein n=1 Tax=Dendrobium chrysotoxum TaxID=161865 RepID=A0AAV7HG65_DENCH|nr:hypothetical protein IEQ34_003044 [Dendrobium chrysotoxum]
MYKAANNSVHELLHHATGSATFVRADRRRLQASTPRHRIYNLRTSRQKASTSFNSTPPNLQPSYEQTEGVYKLQLYATGSATFVQADRRANAWSKISLGSILKQSPASKDVAFTNSNTQHISEYNLQKMKFNSPRHAPICNTYTSRQKVCRSYNAMLLNLQHSHKQTEGVHKLQCQAIGSTTLAQVNRRRPQATMPRHRICNTRISRQKASTSYNATPSDLQHSHMQLEGIHKLQHQATGCETVAQADRRHPQATTPCHQICFFFVLTVVGVVEILDNMITATLTNVILVINLVINGDVTNAIVITIPLHTDNATTVDSRPFVACILVELDIFKSHPVSVWLGPKKFEYVQNVDVSIQPIVSAGDAFKDREMIITDDKKVVFEFCNASYGLTLHDKGEIFKSKLLQHLNGESGPSVVPALLNLTDVPIQVDDVRNEYMVNLPKNQCASPLVNLPCVAQEDCQGVLMMGDEEESGRAINEFNEMYNLSVGHIVHKVFSHGGGKRHGRKSKR